MQSPFNDRSGDGTIDLEEVVFKRRNERVRVAARLERWFSILRYYRWNQLIARGANHIQRQFRRNAPVGAIRAKTLELHHPSWKLLGDLAELVVSSQNAHISHRHADLATGKVVLLCEAHERSSESVRQHDDLSRRSHLWRFHWHYHEYLISHVADHGPDSPNPEQAWPIVWSILQSWLDDFPPERTAVSDDAWHPYCISRRLPAWLILLRFGAPGRRLCEAMLTSISRQAAYLATHLETDIGGNHLLENLTALALVDLTTRSPDSNVRLQITVSRLISEIERQILPHGEHFERSPVYHCQVLANLLKVLYLSRTATDIDRERLRRVAETMLAFIRSILHPDGEAPLFADSVFYESPSISQIRQLAMLNGLNWPDSSPEPLSNAGPYYVFRSRSAEKPVANSAASTFLVADFGQVGAEELPGHAHCDLMNFEVSIDGDRWITDSGNYDYEDSIMRSYCRSSIAHNVMTIDMIDQCDVWSKFRMGRRGRVIRTNSGRESRYCWIAGMHDAYLSNRSSCLGRMIAVGDEGDVCVADWCDRAIDQSREMVGIVHLAPAIEVERSAGLNNHFLLRRAGNARAIQFFGCDRVEIGKAWYCPAFGLRERRTALVYFNRLQPTIPCGWHMGQTDLGRRVESNEQGVLLKSVDPATILFDWKQECI
jgi:uncharacterized heparinase superfamily protein